MHACASIGVNPYIVLVENIHFETVAPSAMQSLQTTVSIGLACATCASSPYGIAWSLLEGVSLHCK